MSSQDVEERSAKRRRLDSDTPDPLSRDHVDLNHHLDKSTPNPYIYTPDAVQSGASHTGTPLDTDIGQVGAYAYDDADSDLAGDGEDESAYHSAEEDADGPQERPTSLDYRLYMTLKGHKRGVAAVKFSPDGKWIASASADCTIKIWDAQTGNLIHNLEGHLAGISTLSWNPDSTILASGSDDKTIRLWDVIKVSLVTLSLMHTRLIRAG